MAALNEPDLDARIEHKLHALGVIVRDDWHDAETAAAHLRMSKAHFLRIANGDDPPDSSGQGRMRRWRTSALDRWQTRKEQADERL
jgi:hypothetical protein